MVKKTVRKGVFTMNIEKTIKSLERNRFKVTYFEQAEDAAKYLDEAIDGKVVGFGDSITMKSIDVYKRQVLLLPAGRCGF